MAPGPALRHRRVTPPVPGPPASDFMMALIASVAACPPAGPPAWIRGLTAAALACQ